MAVLSEFEPLRVETVDTIRARVDANVNAGLDPADSRWQDTETGHWWSDHMQSISLELEELYDYISLELPASFFLPFSWGIYLDYWGEMLSVPRNQPVAALGTVTFTNATGADIDVPTGTTVQVPPTDPDADPLAYTTTAPVTVPGDDSADVAIVATEPGAAWNVAAHAVSQVPTISGLTVDNAVAISGGADEELDEPYKARLLLEFTGTRGGGTPDDYIAETLARFPSVGHVVVERAWAGPNTVRLIISDADQQPLSGPIVAEVQAYWDDAAPIGSTATVATVAALPITVAADIEFEPGFSLAGTAGTQPLQEDLDAAVAEWFAELGAGMDVLHNRGLEALLGVNGVYNVPALTLDDGTGPTAGDVAVPALSAAQFTAPGDYTEAP